MYMYMYIPQRIHEINIFFLNIYIFLNKYWIDLIHRNLYYFQDDSIII